MDCRLVLLIEVLFVALTVIKINGQRHQKRPYSELKEYQRQWRALESDSNARDFEAVNSMPDAEILVPGEGELLVEIPRSIRVKRAKAKKEKEETEEEAEPEEKTSEESNDEDDDKDSHSASSSTEKKEKKEEKKSFWKNFIDEEINKRREGFKKISMIRDSNREQKKKK